MALSPCLALGCDKTTDNQGTSYYAEVTYRVSPQRLETCRRRCHWRQSEILLSCFNRGIRSLPSNLHEALHHAKKSEFLRELLGESTVENYLELKYKEFDSYRVQVSQWELDRYFGVL